MKQFLKLSLLFLLLVVFHQVSAQDSDCIYDSTSITPEFLENIGNIHSYKWFEETKEATILMNNGEYIHFKKWACDSYGMELKKVTVVPLLSENKSIFYVNSFEQLGRMFLNKEDFEIFSETLKNTDWVEKERIEFVSKNEFFVEHDTYPEFYGSIERNRDMVIMSIYYYTN